MNPPIARRTLLLGSAATGALAWTGASTLPAFAEALVYNSPEAFDAAQAAYLATNPQHNEVGLYAWGESYFLLGLLRMYDAYGDLKYLHTFEQRAAHLTATTDAARGVTDYRGRSGKVWRTAGNYTAGHGVLPDGNGRAAVQLRWAGTRSGESTAEVTNVSGSTFDLILRNPATTAVVTLRGVSLDPAAASYVVSAVNNAYTAGLRWTAVDLRTSPGDSSPPEPVTITFQPQYYVFAVHTGMIAHPLARYVRMVFESPRLKRGGRMRIAQKLLAAVRAAVTFHDSEYAVRPDGSGDYVWPKGAPVPFDGTIQPYNQSHGLGQVLVELYRATGERRYRTRTEQLLKGFRAGLTLGPEGAYVWPYWPLHSELYTGYPATAGVSEYTPSYPASRQIEDISHAAISLEFVQAAYEAGVDDGLAADVQRFTATFTQNVIRSETEVWLRVNGTTTAVPANAVQCARWGAYAEHDPLVYEQSLRVYDAVQLVPSQGSHALGIAYLNWAEQGAWRKQ
ncbi:hypothetical protein E1218_24780 [Kribbella turkmenica]|uniref:D-glucuronyl C5-epimerase C-terminal domain-containing protein n=1 Tax=Kribbella turkmenica TaxID=2530375 RepID=A0A4R4WKQ9_9ACTN|nr:hypothetical protein [Kribbella turkmenica]TDD19081.1 hypothetical protein E1218_24780 [Kribbella turkmenica]